MKSINNGVKYRGCDFADDLLKPNIRNWLDKNNFKNTLKVPIRRKGLTGSGMKGECHGNVLNLVKAFGGKRMSGFAIRETLMGDRIITDFFRHSVWITPENNAVDVTAHNFLEGETTHFLPMYEENNLSQLPCNFGLSDDILDIGVWISHQQYSIDLKVAISEGFKFISNFNYQSFILVPNKFFSKSKLFKEHLGSFSSEKLISVLRLSGFLQPSSATDKTWQEIFEKRVIPKCS
jgi:hypothetical protein